MIQKKILLSKNVFLTGLMAVVLGLVTWMFFSHDPGLLKDHYPHAISMVPHRRFELRKKIPKDWVELKAISRFAQGAIVLSEDWGFYEHSGVDFEEIQIALWDIVSFKKIRGASTISQQLMKNTFLSSKRSLGRKIHETILALKLARSVEKKRILELYLNVVEFGDNLYGIKRASFYYFGKPPSELNPREGAFLAMLLPSPKRYEKSFRQKKLTPFARKRVEEILVKMRMGKVITKSEYEVWRSERFSWEK
jgi:monofunctional biosynthetic peptidoglycan transglycosylase